MKRRLERDGHEVCPIGRGSPLPGFLPDGCGAVINCAAALDDVQEMASVNVLGTKLWLDRVRELGIQRFIQIGSSSETGPVEGPRSETTFCQPSNLYEATKLAATNLCLGYSAEFDMDVCVARPFTLYGPNDKPRKMLPTLWRAFCEHQPFHCYPGGHDWLHVEDFVEGIVRLLNAPREATKGQIYHFGTGASTSNAGVVELFAKAVGSCPEMVYHSEKFRPYDVEDWRANWSKAKARLGWEPKIGLAEGIRSYVNDEWFKQSPS